MYLNSVCFEAKPGADEVGQVTYSPAAVAVEEKAALLGVVQRRGLKSQP